MTIKILLACVGLSTVLISCSKLQRSQTSNSSKDYAVVQYGPASNEGRAIQTLTRIDESLKSGLVSEVGHAEGF